MKRLAILVAVFVSLSLVASNAQSPVPNINPLVGQWKPNLDKSTYFPGPRPAPGGGGRNYIDRGNGLIAEVRLNVGATGAPALGNVWSGKFDGTATPVYGQGALLTFLEAGTKSMATRSYRVVDASTLEATNRNGMVVANTATLAVAKDGKTMTETVKNFNMQGQQVGMNVIVYDRQ